MTFRKTVKLAVDIAEHINERLEAVRLEMYFDPDSDTITNHIEYIGTSKEHYEDLVLAVKKLKPDATDSDIEYADENIEEITKIEIRGDSVNCDFTDTIHYVYIDTAHDQLEIGDVAHHMNHLCDMSILEDWWDAAILLVQQYQLSLGWHQKFGISDGGEVEYNIGHWVCRVWDRESEAFKMS